MHELFLDMVREQEAVFAASAPPTCARLTDSIQHGRPPGVRPGREVDRPAACPAGVGRPRARGRSLLKWAQIKRKKGATDAKRGQLFSKLARRSSWLRRAGPIPPETLRPERDREGQGSLHAEGQHRAGDRARSWPVRRRRRLRDRDARGYGPAGVAVYVEAVTDNRNRTAAEVRHIFAKADGSLGESGSVAWLFERRAAVLVDGSAEDELTLAAAEGGADDVEHEGDSWRVTAPPEALGSVREAVEAAGMTVESADPTMPPKTTVGFEDEAAAKKVIRQWTRSRTTTTSRTSTRTSTSPSACWRPSRVARTRRLLLSSSQAEVDVGGELLVLPSHSSPRTS